LLTSLRKVDGSLRTLEQVLMMVEASRYTDMYLVREAIEMSCHEHLKSSFEYCEQKMRDLYSNANTPDSIRGIIRGEMEATIEGFEADLARMAQRIEELGTAVRQVQRRARRAPEDFVEPDRHRRRSARPPMPMRYESSDEDTETRLPRMTRRGTSSRSRARDRADSGERL
jgi:hypothetical protein